MDSTKPNVSTTWRWTYAREIIGDNPAAAYLQADLREPGPLLRAAEQHFQGKRKVAIGFILAPLEQWPGIESPLQASDHEDAGLCMYGVCFVRAEAPSSGG